MIVVYTNAIYSKNSNGVLYKKFQHPKNYAKHAMNMDKQKFMLYSYHVYKISYSLKIERG